MANYVDKAGITYVIGRIKTLLSGKVNVESGKGLSTNDYTTAEKNKLAGIATGANKYTLPVAGSSLGGVKSGTDITVDSSGNVSVNDNSHGHTTSNVSGLDTALSAKAPLASPTLTGTPKAPTPTAGNSSTQIATTAFVMNAVAGAVGGVTSISYEVVSSLPATGETGKIYLMSNSGTSPNIYDEYLYISGSFEKIGTTEIDLSGYMLSSDMVPISNTEIDAMFA